MMLFSYVVQIKVTSINTGNTCQPLGTSYLTEIMISETVYMLLFKKNLLFNSLIKLMSEKKTGTFRYSQKNFDSFSII